jgi:hypothetical protein
MTRYPVAANGLPLVQWGPVPAASQERRKGWRPPRFVDPREGPRLLFAGLAEAVVGLILVVGWVLLLTFLIAGVAAPAGLLTRVSIEDHPSLGIPAPALEAGGRQGTR